MAQAGETGQENSDGSEEASLELITKGKNRVKLSKNEEIYVKINHIITILKWKLAYHASFDPILPINLPYDLTTI